MVISSPRVEICIKMRQRTPLSPHFSIRIESFFKCIFGRELLIQVSSRMKSITTALIAIGCVVSFSHAADEDGWASGYGKI